MLTTWKGPSHLDRIFDDMMGVAFGTATNAREFGTDVDVRTNDNEVRIVCDVPGVKREDIDITLTNHVLTIKGSRKFENHENEQVMLGRSYGTFARQFTLPDALDTEKLDASLADGVLTITVPRLPQAKPIKIAVNGGDKKQLNE